MTLQYLQDILIEAKRLSWSRGDYDTAEDLKIKGSQALLKLFPRDITYAGDFSRIYFQLPSFRDRKYFDAGKTKMISMLEAKIDILQFEEQEHKNQNEENGEKLIQMKKEMLKWIGEADSYRMKYSSLIASCNKYEEEEKKYIEQINEMLDTNKVFLSEIDRLKRRNIWWGLRNGIVWTFIVFALGILYTIGYNQGINKSEYKINEMERTIQTLTTDSLKKAEAIDKIK